METDVQMKRPAPAETFSAAVATASVESAVEFSADARTRCGGGMGNTVDD